MTIGVMKMVGGGCKCTDINNHRRSANERFNTNLGVFACSHTHAMASSIRAAKKKGKKRAKKAGA